MISAMVTEVQNKPQLQKKNGSRHCATPTVYGGLEPAIVTDVAEDHLLLLTRDGLSVPLNWADGLENLRLYKTVNARTAPIPQRQSCFPGEI